MKGNKHKTLRNHIQDGSPFLGFLIKITDIPKNSIVSDTKNKKRIKHRTTSRKKSKIPDKKKF